MIIKIPPAPGIISGLDPAEPEAASGVGRIPDLAAPSVDENSFLNRGGGPGGGGALVVAALMSLRLGGAGLICSLFQ
jgi:hypothetical protein